MKKLFALLFLCSGCYHPIKSQTYISSNSTQIEFSPIRFGLKSQDLKNDDLIVSVNVIYQNKYNGDLRSVVEVRGMVKFTRSPEKLPTPNGFVIGPKFRW